ncbi:hypothetical protein Micbo1qcDRAFT_8389 [Microdochium bolleyi]|uniref:Uncharacterized protein n=1 Tax=Microdochium bolleyi TaxID=196109 RepID=A0A136JK47_9PEZI|nr:hypothetical protein Micbo1qcDRAFT_8389 [Microdochium bolleyi]
MRPSFITQARRQADQRDGEEEDMERGRVRGRGRRWGGRGRSVSRRAGYADRHDDRHGFAAVAGGMRSGSCSAVAGGAESKAEMAQYHVWILSAPCFPCFSHGHGRKCRAGCGVGRQVYPLSLSWPFNSRRTWRELARQVVGQARQRGGKTCVHRWDGLRHVGWPSLVAAMIPVEKISCWQSQRWQGLSRNPPR